MRPGLRRRTIRGYNLTSDKGGEVSSSLIIAYLFLGGAGAGMLFVLSAVSFFSPSRDLDLDGSGRLQPWGSYARLYGLGYCVSLAICIVAALCLVFDMARPDAILGLIFNPNVSVVSIGAYGLGLCIALNAALAIIWLSHFRPNIMLCRIVSALAIVAACVVMSYTGLLLGIIPHAAFWQSPLIVVLFVLSSLSCGIALVVLAMMAFRLLAPFWNAARTVLLVDGVLIGVELIVLTVFIASSQQSAPEAVETLVTGDLAALFWTGLVAMGLVVPLAMELASRWKVGLDVHPCIPAVLVLIGGLCLRICIVFAA